MAQSKLAETTIDPHSTDNSWKFDTFPNVFKHLRTMAASGMDPSGIFGDYGLYGGLQSFPYSGPFVQNARTKRIGTSPIAHTKDEIADMLRKPQDSELPLRQASKELDFASYTYHHMRRVYTNLLTYHSYIVPDMIDESAMNDAFWREYRLADKLRKVMKPQDLAREAAGKVMLEGKVFYTYRVGADKPRNRVNYAFYQQLPSDWVKIVGYNNVSKYTLAFNMMYFAQPGTDVRQFPDGLFNNYWEDFASVVTPRPTISGGKVIYAAKTGIDMDKLRTIRPNAEAYNENGRWYYWVTLPVDKAFTIEADDAIPDVIPPLSGLFISLLQFADLEKLQLSLYQNPLIGFFHGEIPYYPSKDTNTADQYMLSNMGRLMFLKIWADLMQAYNTGGVPAYFAPVQNMRLETFNAVEGTSEIVSTGNKDIITQAGLSGIIPASDEARAGAVQVSLQIESKYLNPVYQGVERLMNCAIQDLRLRNDFTFHMFGDVYEDAQLEKRLTGDMTLGILPATILYDALHDRSILDDICWSEMIEKSGVLDLRIPLVSSFHQSADGEDLPPRVKHDIDPGGRPETGPASSDGKEQDTDSLAYDRLYYAITGKGMSVEEALNHITKENDVDADQ